MCASVHFGGKYAGDSARCSNLDNTTFVSPIVPVDNGFTFNIPVPEFMTVPVTITSSAPKSHHVNNVTASTRKLVPRSQRDLVQGSGSVIISEY